MNNSLSFLYPIISSVSGLSFDPIWEEKLPFILQGLFLTIVFIFFFILFYRKYFWSEVENRRMLYFTLSGLFLLILTKYVLYHFAKGYFFDRLFFYALPSPRLQNIAWFIFPVALFLLFLKLKKKIESLSKYKFLFVVIVFSTILSLSVASLRHGLFGIAEPLTREKWEYAGALSTVDKLGVSNFLSSFNSILPDLPVHAQTHPPGYILFLYFWQSLLSANYLVLGVVIAVAANLTLLPLYYLWEKESSQENAKKTMLLFIFLPSFVIFSATSMEALFLLLVWSAVVLCYFGWRNNIWLSLAGGLILFYAFFSNFLFLLFLPFLFLLFIYVSKNITGMRWKSYINFIISFLTVVLLFAGLGYFEYYNIIDNFFKARTINQQMIESNFASIGTFLSYMIMNVLAFSIYLGLPLLYVFLRNWSSALKSGDFWLKSSLGLLFFFLMVGIFQGEVERIWLFLTPPLVFSCYKLYNIEKRQQFDAILSLLFFQIIIFQMLFYTYW